jgi:hypothetical protein
MSKDVNNISNRGSVQKATQDLDLEYKKKKIAFTIQVSKLNTSRVQTPEEMKERLDEMFELCIETGNIPTYECMAVACGIPIRTFYDMKQGEYEGYKQYSQIIKNAKDTIALMESSMAVDGKIPANVWIFRAKNYLGMRDQIQVEAVSNQSGDVPNQTGAILENLPEAPEIEAKAEVIESKITASE